MTTVGTQAPSYRFVFSGILTLLAWVSIPHGSELPWEYGFVATIALSLLAIWLFQHWRSARPLPEIVLKLRVPLILMGVWLGYIAIQTIPMPSASLKELSPSAAALQDYSARDGGAAATPLSVDPGNSLKELARNASYLAVFFLVLAVCDSLRRLRTMALLLFLVGLTQALYSLVNHFTDGAFSLFDPIPPWGNPWSDSTRGTFSNRNHFGGFMALTIPVGLGLLFADGRRSPPHQSWRSRLATLLGFFMSKRAAIALSIGLMLAALLFSKSRGANLSFLLGFLLAAGVFAMLRGARTSELRIFPLVSVLLLLAITWLGLGGLPERILDQGLAQHGRDLLRSSTVDMWQDYPLFGSGAGTYPHLYPLYKDPGLGTTAMSMHAHCDYLELLAEQGVIGTLIIGSALLLLAGPLVHGIRSRRNRLSRGILFAVVFSLGAMLVQSVAEFNFRIPANAMFFFALLAMGLAASERRPEQHGSVA